MSQPLKNLLDKVFNPHHPHLDHSPGLPWREETAWSCTAAVRLRAGR